MSLFDSIISEAGKRFGLGDKAGVLLSALLGLMTDRNRGGFTGFLDRFSGAGLGDVASSWISSGSNTPLSDEQVESAFTDAEINEVASKAGVSRQTATSAMAYMVPQVIDKLTPDGEVPDEKSLLSTIGGYLSGIGGAALGTAGAAGAAVSNAFGNTAEAGRRTVDSATAGVRDAAGNVSAATSRTINRVDDTIDSDGGSPLKWLLPLILLGLALLLGYWFCSKPPAPPAPAGNMNTSVNKVSNTNVNANATAVESSFKIEAKDGKYVVTGVVQDEATKKKIVDAMTAQYGAGNIDFSGLKVDAAAKPFGAGWWDNFAKMLPNLKDWKTGTLAFAGSAITAASGLPQAAMDQLKSLFSGWTMPTMSSAPAPEGERKLTDVSLPSGTKLQAYPGGIEDQLIKFIQSDEYKNGTNDTLKDKWFNFDDLNFKFNSTELVPESKRQLDNITAILKAFPDVKIKIGGYTDKKGDDAANLKLSDSRAKAVKAALEKSGVGAQVPEAEGYGEKFATVDEGASDKEREKDRKTSVRLMK